MRIKKFINLSMIVIALASSGYAMIQKSASAQSGSPAINLSSDCNEKFINGERPTIINKSLNNRTTELCFAGFVVYYSGIVKSPLYSSEHLTKEMVIGGRQIGREDVFHEETRLNENDRSTLKDFKGSHYDRGHMVPSDDMPNFEMQAETFSLANMIMQNPKNNRGIHKQIEGKVRDLAYKVNDLYVITGPAFTSDKIEKKGNVFVPNYVWKAVYIPKFNKASAYWEKNDDSAEYEIISISELKNRIGIDVFPSLDEKIKEEVVNLPRPKRK